MTACITLDLEPDYGGRLSPTYAAWDAGRLEALLALLAAHGAPLTIFVVGESLAAQPGVIERLRTSGAEFHLHSFSHDLARPDTLDEIRRGAAAFEACFARRPEGYRAPEGRISPAGWSRLEDEGFLFDSSVFPSFWPAPRYLRFWPRPFRPEGRRLLELPISTVTPARLIVSLSWMKLLGWAFYERLLETDRLPEPIVFDMHLHDLWETPSFDRLPRPWSWIYRRNRGGGLRILEAFLGLLARRGHRLTTLGAVARDLAGAPC